ncbi:MAG: hypothetical protein KF757_11475 [Phycisphaeraceae bacterium]|nr:hypothetical protein [Phycisphaeraceae bacterium]MCW5762307.1 hypothetical protein [Phycisphaeraceae bacterium]
MTITIARAKAICSKPELGLVHWSTRQRVKDLTPSRLAQKLALARKLRDKYRDLVNQQTREQRGKSTRTRTRPVGDNKNTHLKLQLFQETLDRFEAALKTKTAAEKVSPPKAKAAKKPAPKETSKQSTIPAPKAAKKKSSAKPRAKNAGGPVSKKTQAKKAARKKVVKKKLAASRATSRSGPASHESRDNLGSSIAAEIQQQQFVAYDKASTANRNALLISQTESPITVHGVAGITKRNQAKRDSRP